MLVRNLWRRKTRTILTLLGIAVGIAAIVTLVALSRGVAANYIQVTSQSKADVTIQAVQEQGQAITLGTGFDEALVDQLRAMPEVKTAAGMLYTMARMPNTPVFIVFGYEPDQVGIRHFKIIEGVTLADHRTRRGGKPILLGKIAAEKLRKGIGQTVRLEKTTFRVVGIYETGTALEDAGGVISLRDAQILADMPRQVMYAGAQLRRPDRAEEFKAKLAKILPPDVEVAGTQVGGMMLQMLELLDVYAWAVALIAAVVGGVGMMNTMLMSVFERTREIGVLRAVGWRRWQVMRMILGESLLLSLIGGGLGLGMGAGLTWLAANTPAMAGLTQDTVPRTLVLQASSTALVLGLLGGLYPAWRASRLPPVEALRYDGGSQQGRASRIPGGMVLKGLARQRTRTVLTLVGVGVGVLAMLLIGSISEGAIMGFNALVSDSEITAVEADQADTSLSAIHERVLKRIEALPQVRYVSGLLFSVITTPSEPFFVITARARSDPALSRLTLREGHLLKARRECLLGWKAAAQQNRGIGDRLSMLGTSFTVVGIVETANAFEDNGAIIDLREAQQLLKKPRQVMTMQVKLVDPRQTDALLARLVSEYPQLLFSKSAEFTESLPDMESMRSSTQAVFLMTIIVGSIALMNTMIMSIYERTREIGVLRAVGWRRGSVLRQVLAEALLLTLTSGAGGIVVSLVAMRILRNMPSLGMYSSMFVMTPAVVMQGVSFCVVLGVIGGLYPAWRATTFSPVEALRYE